MYLWKLNVYLSAEQVTPPYLCVLSCSQLRSWESQGICLSLAMCPLSHIGLVWRWLALTLQGFYSYSGVEDVLRSSFPLGLHATGGGMWDSQGLT